MEKYSFIQYEKNKNVSRLSDPIPIKYLPEGENYLFSIIATIIKEGDYSDAWEIFAHHCANGIFQDIFSRFIK